MVSSFLVDGRGGAGIRRRSTGHRGLPVRVGAKAEGDMVDGDGRHGTFRYQL